MMLIIVSSKVGIHAKRECDEDARQPKVIQDLNFEDGDLDADGGKGRVQNLRWKNIDATADGDGDGDVKGVDDDDDDEAPLIQTMEETETQKVRFFFLFSFFYPSVRLSDQPTVNG